MFRRGIFRMRMTTLGLLALLFLSLVAEARETLRAATYNLENYNLAHRMTPDGFAPNHPKPEAAKTALRRIIRAMNPDLLAVQEIGGPEFLEELRRDLAHDGIRFPHTAWLDGPDPHRRVAVLSKLPIETILAERRLVTGFELPSPNDTEAVVNRGLLGVRVRVNGRPVELYTLHLKSRLTRDKRDPRSERERLAESETIRAALHRAGIDRPGRLALVAGDFNDGPNSRVLTRFAAPPEHTPLVRLEPKDHRGETHTYRNDRKGLADRSDYIFVTPALAEHIVRHQVVDRFDAALASDHRPLVVDFRIPPAPENKADDAAKKPSPDVAARHTSAL